MGMAAINNVLEEPVNWKINMVLYQPTYTQDGIQDKEFRPQKSHPQILIASNRDMGANTTNNIVILLMPAV